MIGKTLAHYEVISKLVWSCRMEELKDFGTFLNTIPVTVEKKVFEAGGGETVTFKI